MRKFYILITLLFSITLFGQDTLYLKGHSRTHDRSHLLGFDSLIHFDSRVDIDRKICHHYSDSTFQTHYLFLEQEEYLEDSLKFELLDTIVIKNYPDNGFILIGSKEFDKPDDENVGFVISMECCYDTVNTDWVYKSENIIRVWTNGNGTDDFHELDPNEIIRYNEGFYKKEKTVPNRVDGSAPD